MTRWPWKRIIWLALAAALPVLATAMIWRGGLAHYEAELRRKDDLLADREKLRTAIAGLQATQATPAGRAALLWAPEGGEPVENRLQAAVLSAAEAHALRLSSFGTGAGMANVAGPSISFQLEAQGGWAAILGFIDALQKMTPPVAISDLTLRNGLIQSERETQVLSLSMTIWGLTVAAR